MDAHERRHALDYGHLAMHVACLIFAIFFAVLVCWLVISKQDSKLYQDDNVVCVSQPLQLTCYQRGH